jgi:peptidoglycan L-alanyl-D-glutamate endopeptidase CwlK
VPVAAILLYFLIACFVVWLVLFPAGREALYQFLHVRLMTTRQRVERWRRADDQVLRRTSKTLSGSLNGLGIMIRRHRLLLAGVVVILIVPPLIAILLSGKSMLPGFDDSSRDANLQIAELLQGEQLVPPPPLPPDLFTTAEVMQVRPMLLSANRNWTLLNPQYAQRLLLVFKIMKEKYGYDLAILEGYRSPERQNTLARMGSNVTNAAAFQSYHQFGLAADCAFLRDGKLQISEKDPWTMEAYRRYGEVAESVGLTWGGRWKMMDFGHTELRLPGVLKK